MNINYASLGKGIYEILTEDDKAVVAFGMIPLEVIQSATDNFKRRCAEFFCDEYGLENVSKDFIEHVKEKAIRKEVINDFEHNLTVAIMQEAKNQGKMIA